eukprot:COSAG01_NODE_11726_length_1871_cov_10.690745_2_plen_103_part_00
MNLGLYCCFKKVTAVTDANIGYTHYNLEELRSYHIHGRYVTYIPRCAVGGTIGEIFLLRWKVNHDQQVQPAYNCSSMYSCSYALLYEDGAAVAASERRRWRL